MEAEHFEDYDVRLPPPSPPPPQQEEGGKEGEMRDQGWGEQRTEGRSQRSTSGPRRLSLVLKFIHIFFFQLLSEKGEDLP